MSDPTLSGFEIRCANKDRRGLIIRVGDVGWSMTTHDAVSKIITSQLRLNIRLEGQPVDLGVRGEGFNACLATEPDGFPLHRLDDLLSC